MPGRRRARRRVGQRGGRSSCGGFPRRSIGRGGKSPCGEPGEQALDGPACRLVPVRAVKYLAQTIEQLLNQPEQRKAMGLAGRRLAEQEFDVRAVVDKHLAIYQRLLA